MKPFATASDVMSPGTLTRRTKNVLLRGEDLLYMSPADAERLSICDNDYVILRSRHGSAKVRARLSDKVRPMELFATFHSPEIMLNAVTGAGLDRMTNAHEYKVTAVSVEKAGG